MTVVALLASEVKAYRPAALGRERSDQRLQLAIRLLAPDRAQRGYAGLDRHRPGVGREQSLKRAFELVFRQFGPSSFQTGTG